MIEKSLTDAELVVLGLIAEMPRHGYDIEAVIEARGMREWTAIGFSSIYFVLGKLEKAELAVAEKPQTTKGRKVYRATREGHAVLQAETRRALAEPMPVHPRVLLGMAHWPVIGDEEGAAALRERARAIAGIVQGVKAARRAQQPLPDFVEALFEYSLTQLEAEAGWVEAVCSGLEGKTGEGKMDKVDFKKTLKHLYAPKAKAFEILEVPAMQFLKVDGAGNPNTSPDYARAVEWLYSVSYPVKFMSKKELGRDYGVPPLEGLWWAEDMDAFVSGDKDQWQWTMMIMQPDWITPEMIEAGIEKAKGKLGEPPASLRLEPYDEGLSVQIMHIGPYSEEGPTIARLHHEFLPANGLTENGHHHEIYIGDPRRTAPEKLKTVLRQPVRRT